MVYVKEHKFFKRNNNDIYCEIPITYTQAAKGDTAAASETMRRALALGPFPQAGAARSELRRLRGG